MNQNKESEHVERMGLIKTDSQAALDLFHEHAKEAINNLIWRFAPPDLYLEEADEMALTLWRSLSEAWDRCRARAGEMAVKLTAELAVPTDSMGEIPTNQDTKMVIESTWKDSTSSFYSVLIGGARFLVIINKQEILIKDLDK